MLKQDLLRTGLVHVDPATVTAAEVDAMVQGVAQVGPPPPGCLLAPA